MYCFLDFVELFLSIFWKFTDLVKIISNYFSGSSDISIILELATSIFICFLFIYLFIYCNVTFPWLFLILVTMHCFLCIWGSRDLFQSLKSGFVWERLDQSTYSEILTRLFCMICRWTCCWIPQGDFWFLSQQVNRSGNWVHGIGLESGSTPDWTPGPVDLESDQGDSTGADLVFNLHLQEPLKC